MLSGKKVFVHCDQLEEFNYPSNCPFNISRAGKVRKTVENMGLLSGSDRAIIAPQALSREQLEKFHTAEYLDAMQVACNGGYDVSMLHMGLGSGDCPVFKGMYEYSRLAAGGTVTAAEAILSGEAVIAFNPSGGYHHAHRDTASGFCYINDIVLGGMTLTEAGKRVLFLDVDVHHTDGVQAAFYDRSDVMTISMHQSPMTLFPGTGYEDEIGTGDGKGYSVNLPMPPGTYDEIYMRAFNEAVVPLIKAYDADMIVVELGADALSADPLAQLSLTNNVYAEVINRLLEFDKPILATGGGGYSVENTVRAWSLCWSVLCGDDEGEDMMAGMGGVMMESTEWHGGLRDRTLVPDQTQRETVDPIVEEVIDKIKKQIFPLHGI